MSKQPVISASVDIKVPFHDVDMMNVVWHGHYVRYIEIARCALLDKIDYNYSQMRDSGYAWPVVDLHVRYPGPARFGDTIKVTAILVEWQDQLKIRYEIHDENGKRITRASSTQVAVEMPANTMCFESPQILLDRVAAAFAAAEGNP